MSLLVRVGAQEDLPPKPKDFPRCGNWYPHGVEDDVTAVPCGGAIHLASLIICFICCTINLYIVK